MNTKVMTFFAAGLILGVVLTACGTKRESAFESSARAEAGDSGKQALPEIKKGAKVRFGSPAHPLGSNHLSYEGLGAATVEEVRGNWARVTFKPTKEAKAILTENITVWANFDTVTWIEVVP